jgi:carbon storage regulator
MITPAEKITFMICRTAIALAISGLAFYGICQGIHYLTLPHQSPEQFQASLLGMRITASGLGAVIFGSGVVFGFLTVRAAPRRITAERRSTPVSTDYECSAAKRTFRIRTRRVGESLMIGNDVTVVALGVKGNQIRLGIKAPNDMSVHGEEIQERIKREQNLVRERHEAEFAESGSASA